MKNLKTFEVFQDLKEEEEPIIINVFPNWNEIVVTPEEFKVLKDEYFNILWNDGSMIHQDNDEPGWVLTDDDEEEEFLEWLKLYRELKDPELVNNALKYNI